MEPSSIEAVHKAAKKVKKHPEKSIHRAELLLELLYNEGEVKHGENGAPESAKAKSRSWSKMVADTTYYDALGVKPTAT